jgi:hypothetical protein
VQQLACRAIGGIGIRDHLVGHGQQGLKERSSKSSS